MILFLAGWWTVSTRAAEPELVQRVAAGELKEARASWWGFDKEDSTRALQAAIDSRVPRLIVDNMGAPWIVNKLKCVSDQEIVFEPGVEVLAKKDAFRGKHDSLFSLVNVSNVTLRGPGATLRMRRADYDAPPYEKAEWRHVLLLRAVSNVRIYGLTLAESGGDGIYLGVSGPGRICRDVHIKDVVCDKNYRQGISVVAAENLLIENTIMRGTAGSAPQAGIDIEPNNPDEPLKNIVLRNCVSQDNKGNGFFMWLTNLRRTSEPVSIRFENCRSVGNGRAAARVKNGNSRERAVTGEIVFSGCRFENSYRPGLNVVSNPEFGLTVTFEDCVVEHCAAKLKDLPDILLENEPRGEEHPVGGVRLDRVTVRSPLARPWIAWNINTVPNPVRALSGFVTAEQPGSQRRIALTREWIRKTFPAPLAARVPRVEAELAKARVIDEVDGVRELSPVWLRFDVRYVLRVGAGQEAVVTMAHTQVDKSKAQTKPLRVLGPSGDTVGEWPLPPFGERLTIQFKVEQAGFYTLEADAGRNAIALRAANVPVAIDATRQALLVFRSEGSLFAAVPRGTGVFALAAAGGWQGEAVKLTVIDPAGAVVWSRDDILQMDGYTATEGEGLPGGLWEMKLESPGGEGFKNYYADVRGVPGYLFPSRERYWTF